MLLPLSLTMILVVAGRTNAFCPTSSPLLPLRKAQSLSITDRIARGEQDSLWRRYEVADSSSSSSSTERVSTEDKKKKEKRKRLSHKLQSEIHWEKVYMPMPVPKNGEISSPSTSNTPKDSHIMSHISWKEVLVPSNIAPIEPHDRITPQDVGIIGLALSISMLLFAKLVSMSGPGAWRYYLAGGLCASFSHAIPVPIDVVKTRKQVDPSLASKTFMETTRHLIQNEGIHSLLAGLGPTMLGYLIEGSIKFGVYEATKPFVRKLLSGIAGFGTSLAWVNSHLLCLLLCAAASGTAASIVLNPMEALRIRLVAEPKEKRKGFVKTGLKMIKDEGPSSMARGVLAMLYKQVPYTIVKNVSFDLSTAAAYGALAARDIVASHQHRVMIPIFSAALASILSCISSQPGDMVLSLINARAGEQRKTHDVIHDILRSERGIAGFFVGLKTRLLHVGIIVTLQLMMYDLIKQLCGIAATGSV